MDGDAARRKTCGGRVSHFTTVVGRRRRRRVYAVIGPSLTDRATDERRFALTNSCMPRMRRVGCWNTWADVDQSINVSVAATLVVRSPKTHCNPAVQRPSRAEAVGSHQLPLRRPPARAECPPRRLLMPPVRPRISIRFDIRLSSARQPYATALYFRSWVAFYISQACTPFILHFCRIAKTHLNRFLVFNV